jgi:hypothetical protein
MLVVVLVNAKYKIQKKITLLSAPISQSAISLRQLPGPHSAFRNPHFLSPLATGKPMRWLE